jgi:hypothetical protein
MKFDFKNLKVFIGQINKMNETWGDCGNCGGESTIFCKECKKYYCVLCEESAHRYFSKFSTYRGKLKFHLENLENIQTKPEIDLEEKIKDEIYQGLIFCDFHSSCTNDVHVFCSEKNQFFCKKGHLTYHKTEESVKICEENHDSFFFQNLLQNLRRFEDYMPKKFVKEMDLLLKDSNNFENILYCFFSIQEMVKYKKFKIGFKYGVFVETIVIDF